MRRLDSGRGQFSLFVEARYLTIFIHMRSMPKPAKDKRQPSPLGKSLVAKGRS